MIESNTWHPFLRPGCWASKTADQATLQAHENEECWRQRLAAQAERVAERV